MDGRVKPGHDEAEAYRATVEQVPPENTGPLRFSCACNRIGQPLWTILRAIAAVSGVCIILQFAWEIAKALHR